MRSKSQRSSVLPHLPKGISLPSVTVSGEQPAMPGQKTLPPDNWREQQLVPGVASNNSNNDNSRAMTTVNRSTSIAKQGVPWTDRQSKIQLDSHNEPPPIFSTAPKRSSTLLHNLRDSQSQKQIYRMENGIHPVVLLTTRLEAWRLAIKSLVALFKKIALVDNRTSKGLVNASKEIVLPFEKGHGQFLETGGIQDVWSAIRDYIMEHGILHHENSGYIQGVVIPSLRAVKADIKMINLEIEKDKALKSNLIFDSRIQVDHLITRLDKVIEQTQRGTHLGDQNTDPFLINLGIIHAVRELCDHENRLHDNILNLQKEIGIFEAKIIENVRHILLKYQEFRLKRRMEDADYVGKVTQTFQQIQPTTEWNDFVRRNQYNLVNESSAYKTEAMVEYPNKDSKYVRAIKIGPLQLKTGMMRSWTEGVYLLTPAGYLHGYKTPKHFQTHPLHPSYSVYVPNSNIEMDEDAFDVRNIKEGRVNLSGYHYTFRAPTRAENQAWFQALNEIADQHRVVPLLDIGTQGYHSTAPAHRSLPPLPASTLPLAIDQREHHESAGAIEGAPSNQAGPSNTQSPNAAANYTGGAGDNYQGGATGVYTGAAAAVTPRGSTSQEVGMNPVYEESTSSTPTQQHQMKPFDTTHIDNQQRVATQSNQRNTAKDVNVEDGNESVDNWHSIHEDPGDDFDTQSKVVDEVEEVNIAQQHLRDAYTPLTNAGTAF